jgi:hypothetical protein
VGGLTIQERGEPEEELPADPFAGA